MPEAWQRAGTDSEMLHYWQNKITQNIVNLLGVLSSILLFSKLDAELDYISLGVLLGGHHTNDA
jgi:hypothetical protein